MSELNQQTFIPFISDYGFKVTFGNERNDVFLKRALRALLQLSKPIRNIKFSKATFEGLHKESRSGIYDMICEDDSGDIFIVEMQMQAQAVFLNRLQFYAFQRFDNLIKKGKFDFNIKERIYCIAILGANISPVSTYHNTLTLKNQDGVEFSNQIQYVTVELEKFNLTVNEVTTDLEKLIFTIKNAHNMVEVKEKPKFWEEDWLNIPMGELDIRTLSPERYEAYQYWLVHEAEAKRYEKEVIEKGRMEGIMQGMMQGKIEGIKEGRMEGRMEGEIKMLKDLVKKGVLSFKSIETVPNISSELIQKAKEEIINELLTEDLLPLSSIAQIADVSEDVVLKVKNARD